MSSKLIINAVTAVLCVFAILFYLDFRTEKQESLEAERIEAMTREADRNTSQAAQRKAPAFRPSASALSIPKDARSGQYHYKGRVNSGYVDFLVDTGASAVALTLADARKAGIRDRDLSYNVPISTAGGRNYAARVTLDQVALGGIILRDVEALIVKEGLETSLLGMTWLGQLQEVKATPNALLLRY